tara:strand:+ start:26066 stop:27847 length:1782 start_codon:yes stop_codon:yes gene_type:complete
MNFMHIITLLLLAGILFSNEPEITFADLLDHVKVLSSERFEGRKSGTRGGRKSARYIAKQFKNFDLKPVGENTNFKKQFKFVSDVKLGRKNKLELFHQSSTFLYQLNVDYRPLGFSQSGEIEGNLVFAGYGISADDLDYDDYTGIDVEGKVVMVLRYSPDGTNPHGKFGKYSSLRYKTMTAREKGAVGIIFVTGPMDDEDETYLKSLQFDQSSAHSGIPAVMITQKRAKGILNLVGYDLTNAQESINTSNNPFSFEMENFQVRIKTSLKLVEAKTSNVIGMIEGHDETLKNEYIVIGAHYDHLGFGEFGSLSPDDNGIHNGADDNASGVAGLLELAEWFSEHPTKRSLIFSCFGAEELGLLGSADFVKNSPVPLKNITAMINMDMIGRMTDSVLVVGGTGTSSVWEEMLNNQNNSYDLTLKFDEPGFGASDHQSFYLKNIPVLFFFSGVHEDYHKSTDDWEKINIQGEMATVKLIRDLVTEIGNNETPPDFQKVNSSTTSRGGFAVYLGTIPDYAATDVEGMKLSGVRDSSPADRGGLKGGDIIVEFGERNVSNIYDYMYCLQEAKAGVPVAISVKRGDEKIVLTVVPAKRKD